MYVWFVCVCMPGTVCRLVPVRVYCTDNHH